jgi:hypothetical protein
MKRNKKDVILVVLLVLLFLAGAYVDNIWMTPSEVRLHP